MCLLDSFLSVSCKLPPPTLSKYKKVPLLYPHRHFSMYIVVTEKVSIVLMAIVIDPKGLVSPLGRARGGD